MNRFKGAIMQNAIYKCIKADGSYEYLREKPSDDDPDFVRIEKVPDNNIIYQSDKCFLIKQ